MKGGRSNELMTRALTELKIAPSTSEASSVSSSGAPATSILPMQMPTRPTSQPMDRSMLPELSTSVKPQASVTE